LSAAVTTAFGNAYTWWSETPHSTPGSGTILRDGEEARAAVDRFMDVSVPRQREEARGYTLAPDRFEYIDGVLTILDQSAQWNRYFPPSEQIAEGVGSVGRVEAAPTGLGGFYLRRFKRQENGELHEELPDRSVAALVKPLVRRDIAENYWGEKVYPHDVYPVAADISNALYPQTHPAYESRRLRAEDEKLVLERRRRGLVGDPIAGRLDEQERLQRQEIAHLEEAAEHRDDPSL